MHAFTITVVLLLMKLDKNCKIEVPVNYMLHATVFSQRSIEARRHAIQQAVSHHQIVPSDTIVLEPEDDKEHISIAAIREFSRRMMLGPTQSPFMAGVIFEADLLTIEAQNALLKIIEEPPSRAVFFLGTATIGALLPTILSRCQVIRITAPTNEKEDSKPDISQFESLLTASPGTIISFVGTIATDRNAVKQWIADAIMLYRQLLIADINNKKSTPRIGRLQAVIVSLESARKDIAVNVTPRLALECALFRINGHHTS